MPPDASRCDEGANGAAASSLAAAPVGRKAAGVVDRGHLFDMGERAAIARGGPPAPFNSARSERPVCVTALPPNENTPALAGALPWASQEREPTLYAGAVCALSLPLKTIRP
jgi:hypothetical protein